jgi:predicted RNA binding protein YcfA (HicA-like mRNA interferase family)
MTAEAKILNSMRSNPRDWQLARLQTVALQHGVDWRHARGSHCVFIRDDGKTPAVPAGGPIKPICIRKFLELMEGG